MSLKNTILSVTRRTKNGFTVREIFNRVSEKASKSGQFAPSYNSVTATVSKLVNDGELLTKSMRKDSTTGRESFTYVRAQ